MFLGVSDTFPHDRDHYIFKVATSWFGNFLMLIHFLSHYIHIFNIYHIQRTDWYFFVSSLLLKHMYVQDKFTRSNTICLSMDALCRFFNKYRNCIIIFRIKVRTVIAKAITCDLKDWGDNFVRGYTCTPLFRN